MLMNTHTSKHTHSHIQTAHDWHFRLIFIKALVPDKQVLGTNIEAMLAQRLFLIKKPVFVIPAPMITAICVGEIRWGVGTV